MNKAEKYLSEKTYQQFMKIGFTQFKFAERHSTKIADGFRNYLQWECFFTRKKRKSFRLLLRKNDGTRIARNSKLLHYPISNYKIRAIYIALATCSLYRFPIFENRIIENTLQILFL